MKILILIPVVLALGLGVAHAAPAVVTAKPILSKVSNTGYGQQGFQQSTECDVFSDRVVITTSLPAAGIQTRELKAAKVNLTQVNALLRKALMGQIQDNSGPTDGVSVLLSGNFVSDTGTTVNVLLSENNGGNGRIRKNLTSEADVLIFTLNQLCR